MVELLFNVKKQDIRVFYEEINRFDAETKVEGAKGKAFGMISNIVKVFDKKKSEIRITDHFRRFEPFWVVKGESYFEYKRNTQYSVDVKPEVVTLKIGNVETDVEEAKCNFLAEDHCVEHFEEEIIKNGHDDRDKGLDKFIGYKTKQIKEIEDLQGEKSFVLPVNYRASFLIRDLVKRLMKPFHADKILKEKVEITQLTLYFKPIHIFELTDSKSGDVRYIEIDALTGDMKKSESDLTKDIKALVFNEGTIFEIGAEVASMIVPGAAIGAIVGKTIHERRKKKKEVKKSKQTKKAYASEIKKKKKTSKKK